MKDLHIAIHDRKGSFSDRWIDYCKEKHISYDIVNCYDSDIITKLRDFDVLLWHWDHGDPKAILFARQFLMSVEHMGIKVFPDINTCWHFDDKVGQKYMLESIGAPLVPSYVFYEKKDAIDWIETTSFPKVFKLRGGAGSTNVHLIKTPTDAKKMVKIAFGRGFRANASYFTDFSTKMKKTQIKKDYLGKIKRLPSSLLNIYLKNKMRSREKGYIYFQDFIPENTYDIRITVIGNRAFGFRRMVRKNDFRASGSGSISYDRDLIDRRCINVAFDVAKSLAAQSVAFDFVMDNTKGPLIVEISYCYMAEPIYNCGGYWEQGLSWHDGGVWPQDLILENMMK